MRTTEPIKLLALTLQKVPEPVRTQIVDHVRDLIDAVSCDTWDGEWSDPSPADELADAVRLATAPTGER